MIENLLPVKIPAGLQRVGTKYEAAGRWWDGDLIRWVEGYPQPIGGWRVAQDSVGVNLSALSGVPRAAAAWRSSDGQVQVAIGTNTHLYVLIGGVVSDITPSDLVTGPADSVLTGGTYGAGLYGAGAYGAGSGALALVEAATWQLDTYGDYLAGVLTTDGRVLIWQGGTDDTAAEATNAPTGCRGVVVTPERFLVALGADGDVRKVAWASQETIDVWTPAVSNTAGDYPLQTNGRIICGRRTKNQTLIWTDSDLHTMNHIGGTLVYSFARVGDNCGIISPNAVAFADSQVYWMGPGGFFLFEGFVRPLPCEVRDYVFENFNRVAAAKIWALSNAEFGEVTWFYPSSSATEVDRYVSYNYRANHWAFGQLARTAGFDGGTTSFPMMMGSDGTMYEHEIGEARGSETPYLESGPLELGTGDQMFRVQRIVPDGAALNDAQMSVYAAPYPTATEVLHGPYSLSNPTNTRITARQVRVRIEEVNPVSWRVGLPRLGVLPLGRR